MQTLVITPKVLPSSRNGKRIVHWRSICRASLLPIAFLLTGTAMAIEEPKYFVIKNTPPFELRVYESLILAEVKVDGDMDSASSQGFRLIAAYIFGKNRIEEKIPMTAPVGLEEKSATIAMTAPVGIESNHSLSTVSFVMPSQYTLASLPQPLDERVQLREVPATKKAVIMFSGFYSEEKVKEKTAELERWIQVQNLQAVGPPNFARYNPPWTLPFLRRNEVMIEVRDR